MYVAALRVVCHATECRREGDLDTASTAAYTIPKQEELINLIYSQL